MRFQRLLVCVPFAVLALAPAPSWAANREMQELQRDVSLLQQQLKDLQRSQDEKLATIAESVRQSIDAASKANTGVAVIQSALNQNLKEQQNQVVGPVVSLGTRMA